MTTNLHDLPIYQKAVDILALSRNISTYLNQDLCYLYSDGKEDEHIYFSGDIVQQSESLAPEIEKVEAERFSENKYRHLESLEQLTYRLNINCKRLENCNSNGRDYLIVLKRELKRFNLLKKSWMLTL